MAQLGYGLGVGIPTSLDILLRFTYIDRFDRAPGNYRNFLI